MPQLLLNTARYPLEKSSCFADNSRSPPISPTSSRAILLQSESRSYAGSDSLSPSADIKVKTESNPSTPFDNCHDSTSTTAKGQSRKSVKSKARFAQEDSSKARINERSKTGCLTCRKRKKKCDERKPSCDNCCKTNYTCEGYPPPKSWGPPPGSWSRNGDTEQALLLPPHQHLATFPAIETEEDHLLLDHYINRTSRILSMDATADSNAWTELILPIAKDDKALMHSVLALAGSHAICTGRGPRLSDRKMFHVDAALSALRRRLSVTAPKDTDTESLVASMIFQFLICKTDVLLLAKPHASLKVARAFLQAPETPFWRFAWSFCQYHELSTSFTSLPGPEPRPQFEAHKTGSFDTSGSAAEVSSTRQEFNVFAGVVDMPFMTIISKVTMLRDRVRQRNILGERPSIHPSMLITADELGREIMQWQSSQSANTPCFVAGQVYRWTGFLYLLRTMRDPVNPASREAFAMCIKNGLDCLKLLSPHDPVQSGLLLPTFILGCGAFEAAHRKDLSHALALIEAYSGFGNVKPVREILSRIWASMDAGDMQRSWDWETVTEEMGYAALIT